MAGVSAFDLTAEAAKPKTKCFSKYKEHDKCVADKACTWCKAPSATYERCYLLEEAALLPDIYECDAKEAEDLEIS